MDQLWAQVLEKVEADLRAADADVEVTQADMERAVAAHAVAVEQQAHMRATHEWVRQQARDPSGVPALSHTPPAQPILPPGLAAPVKPRKLFGKDMPATPLTQLSMETLEKMGRSASTKQVRESLARDGHEYSQSQVRAALKYLAGKKNPPIESTKAGVWRLRTNDAPVPFKSAGVTVMNGAGRTPLA